MQEATGNLILIALLFGIVGRWDWWMGCLMLIQYILASLDVRQGRSPQLPLALQFIGFVAAVFGYDFLLVWAMVSNALFVTTVRIQTDRQFC